MTFDGDPFGDERDDEAVSARPPPQAPPARVATRGMTGRASTPATADPTTAGHPCATAAALKPTPTDRSNEMPTGQKAEQ